MSEADMYRDGERRYFSDPAFKAGVDWLFDLAIDQGYTPGELKQMAFMAALRAEQYAKQVAAHAQSWPVARTGSQGS